MFTSLIIFLYSLQRVPSQDKCLVTAIQPVLPLVILLIQYALNSVCKAVHAPGKLFWTPDKGNVFLDQTAVSTYSHIECTNRAIM